MERLGGLRARGGFENRFSEMERRQGRVAIIKSTIGGNLRLRVHNTLAMDGMTLVKAEGDNPNPLFEKARNQSSAG